MSNERGTPFSMLRRPTLSVILEFTVSHGIEIDIETAERLVRVIHSHAIPLDGRPEEIERAITDLLDWLAGSVEHDAGAAERLRNAACEVSAAMLRAGLVATPRCVRAPVIRDHRAASSPTRDTASVTSVSAPEVEVAAPRTPNPSWATCITWVVTAAAGALAASLSVLCWGVQATAGAPIIGAIVGLAAWAAARARLRTAVRAERVRHRLTRPATSDHSDRDAEPTDRAGAGPAESERPPRVDRIYETPVRVEVPGQGSGIVRHPPWDGRVRVGMPLAGPTVVALDDLAPEGRQALRKALVRPRVEVQVRCVEPVCNKAFTAWVTPDGRVEDSEGEPVQALETMGLLFHACCEEHSRRPGESDVRSG